MIIAIMGTLVILAIVMFVALCKIAAEEDRYIQSLEHICKYNDIKGCYERCCAYCNARHVCKRVCVNDPSNCGGYSFEKRLTKVVDIVEE